MSPLAFEEPESQTICGFYHQILLECHKLYHATSPVSSEDGVWSTAIKEAIIQLQLWARDQTILPTSRAQPGPPSPHMLMDLDKLDDVEIDTPDKHHSRSVRESLGQTSATGIKMDIMAQLRSILAIVLSLSSSNWPQYVDQWIGPPFPAYTNLFAVLRKLCAETRALYVFRDSLDLLLAHEQTVSRNGEIRGHLDREGAPSRTASPCSSCHGDGSHGHGEAKEFRFSVISSEPCGIYTAPQSLEDMDQDCCADARTIDKDTIGSLSAGEGSQIKERWREHVHRGCMEALALNEQLTEIVLENAAPDNASSV